MCLLEKVILSYLFYFIITIKNGRFPAVLCLKMMSKLV